MGGKPLRDLRPVTARRWLIGITIVAGILCFTRLSFPPALTDEAFTFWRTCGSFRQMLDTLRLDAFTPLHYEIVWAVTQILGHGEWAMRLPSAIAGTLMPLAIFGVTRSIAGRRAGVIAAAFVATSAFLAYFDRNAKMYACAWLMLTFSIGCALAYAKTGRRLLAWWFAFCGLAAVGFYSLTVIVLALSPVIVLVAAGRQRGKRISVALLTTLLISGTAYAYYHSANQWFTTSGGLSHANAEGQPADHDNGLMWIAGWQRGRTPRNTLVSCVSSYLFAFEWLPAGYDGDPNDTVFAHVQTAARIGLWAVAGVALIGGATLLLRRGHARRRRTAAFTFAICIALPVYAIALRSYEPLTPPWTLAGGVLPTIGIALFASFLLAGRLSRQRVLRGLLTVLGIFTLFIATWLGVLYVHDHQEQFHIGSWNNLWMPRYTGLVAPFLLSALAAAIANLPLRSVRGVVVIALIAANLVAVVARMTTETEWPANRLAADEIRTIRQSDWLLAVSWRTGLIDPTPFSLPGPYYQLVRAAEAEVEPITFRERPSWPYRPGSAVAGLIGQIRWTAELQLFGVKSGINHVAIWRRGEVDGEPAIPGFRVVAKEEHRLRYTWTWEEEDVVQRFDLERE